jgi:hypothetical protein
MRACSVGRTGGDGDDEFGTRNVRFAVRVLGDTHSGNALSFGVGIAMVRRTLFIRAVIIATLCDSCCFFLSAYLETRNTMVMSRLATSYVITVTLCRVASVSVVSRITQTWNQEAHSVPYHVINHPCKNISTTRFQ